MEYLLEFGFCMYNDAIEKKIFPHVLHHYYNSIVQEIIDYYLNIEYCGATKVQILHFPLCAL